MAKKQGRPRGNASFVPPFTDLADTRERNRGGVQIERAEEKALDFAEDLGRLLGTTQRKAEEWLGQRTTLAERLTQIRDAANSYLQQLSGSRTVGGIRGPGRPAGSTRRPRGIDVGGFTARAGANNEVDGDTGGNGRKQKRRGMTAAQRRAVGERMKKYWAARRKAEGKK